MASMREIKLRIKSVKETRQITKAMKLISAAKLKKARQQLEQTLPFFDAVERTMADILMHSSEVESVYFDARSAKPVKKIGFIVLTGDKGLAGGYNGNIMKLAEHEIKKAQSHVLMVAGNVGRNFFSRNKYNMLEDFNHPVVNPTTYRAREISQRVLELYRNGEIDELYIIFTKMISSMKLEPQTLKLLPLDKGSLKDALGIQDSDVREDTTLNYEPSSQAVFNVLVPKYIKGMVYGALVESFTSEQSARMTAMDSATSNAEEMLQKLNLHYNRARQAAITQEISEIVGGAAALK